jgi:thiol-disulfide isomerase/thioredoxin
MTRFAFFLATLAFGACRPSPPTSPAEPAPIALDPVQDVIDREAPSLAFAGLAGDSLRLAEFRGKVVLVNFWATWCAPCREEIPDLIALQQELGGEDFAVIGVAQILYEGEADEVKAYVADNGMTYPIALDLGPAGQAFGGILALPSTFVIDRDFVVRRRFIGRVTRADLDPILHELIAGG